MKKIVEEPWSGYYRNLDKLYLKPKVRDAIQTLIKEAYLYNNITHDILGTRKRVLVDTNAIVAKLIRQYFKVGYANIGKILNRNHATIIHYVNHYEECLCLEEEWKNCHDYLCEIIHHLKYGSFNLNNYDVSSLNYSELKNAFHSLLIRYRKTQEQLIEIKTILGVSNEE